MENKIVSILIIVVLVVIVLGSVFTYLGNSWTSRTCTDPLNLSTCSNYVYGMGNTTSNPDTPTWLSPVLMVLVGIVMLYLIFYASDLGIGKSK